MAEIMDDPDSVDGEENLADAFWAVARCLRHRARATLGPLDVTPSQSRAMRVLTHTGALRLSELADRLRIAPRSATEVVDGLQERGLVCRTPDPNDRRATLVRLTESGAELWHQVRAVRRAEAERLFGGLTDADRADLARILRRLRG